MYNGTIISLISIMTQLSHLSHPYDTFQFCLLFIIKHYTYDIIIHIIYIITLITIIHIIFVTIPVFNVRSSCDGPEAGHKTWVHEQGLRTNQGSSSAKTLMTHSLNKEASQLLCEAMHW